ncbi:hypothetical protein ACIP4W_12360 [Streptomyces sp. NPDC088846]|uniref:hypothetical protein n=1 Tax=Streptomyces sp. NPDC088846 TaxID=3365908 RepID=UPI003815EC03
MAAETGAVEAEILAGERHAATCPKCQQLIEEYGELTNQPTAPGREGVPGWTVSQHGPRGHGPSTGFDRITTFHGRLLMVEGDPLENATVLARPDKRLKLAVKAGRIMNRSTLDLVGGP